MENATRLQNLEVLGDLEVHGATKNGSMKEADFKVTAADAAAAAAAGAAPTKAEFDAVVTLVNELKAKHNKLVKQLATGKAT